MSSGTHDTYRDRGRQSAHQIRGESEDMMSSSLAVAVGAAFLAASCIAAVPAEALAGDENPVRVVLRDGPGDVLGQSGSEDFGLMNRPTADITRARARHGGNAVTARMRFVNLRRVDGTHLFYATMQTRMGNFEAVVEASPDDWRGNMVLSGPAGRHRRCTGMTHRVDYADDRVTIRVPRRCLGSPAWVRVSLLNGVEKPLSAEDGDEWFADNPHNHRLSQGRTQRLSPP